MAKKRHPVTRPHAPDEILCLERVVLGHRSPGVDEHPLCLGSRHEEHAIDEPGVAVGDEVVVRRRMLGEQQRVGASPLGGRHDALDLPPAVVGEGRMDVEIAAVFVEIAAPLQRLPRGGKRLHGLMNGRDPRKRQPIDRIFGSDRARHDRSNKRHDSTPADSTACH